MKSEIRMLLEEFQAKEELRNQTRDAWRNDDGMVEEFDYPAWDEMRTDQAYEAEEDLQELLTLLNRAVNG